MGIAVGAISGGRNIYPWISDVAQEDPTSLIQRYVFPYTLDETFGLSVDLWFDGTNDLDRRGLYVSIDDNAGHVWQTFWVMHPDVDQCLPRFDFEGPVRTGSPMTDTTPTVDAVYYEDWASFPEPLRPPSSFGKKTWLAAYARARMEKAGRPHR